MYSDKKQRFLPLVILAAVLVIAVAAALAILRPWRDIDEESIAAIEDAVHRSALQCYVVEGVYPADLEYLEEKYGLQINLRRYYVAYEAFSSNLPPTVRVVPRS